MGYWNIGTPVNIIHMQTQFVLGKIERSEGMPASCILFMPLEGDNQEQLREKASSFHLLIGYADGSLDIMVYHSRVTELMVEGGKVDEQTKIISMRRLMGVGTSPIQLTPFENNDRSCVLVACNFPSVLYWANEIEVVNSRLLFDPMVRAAQLKSGAVAIQS